MTNLLIPDLRPGSMLFFPSEWVHMVAAYLGTRPRITMSWNISPDRLPGKPEAQMLFSRGTADRRGLNRRRRGSDSGILPRRLRPGMIFAFDVQGGVRRMRCNAVLSTRYPWVVNSIEEGSS